MRKTCSAGLTNNQMLLEAIMNVIEDQVYHHIEVYLAHVKGKIVVAYIQHVFSGHFIDIALRSLIRRAKQIFCVFIAQSVEAFVVIVSILPIASKKDLNQPRVFAKPVESRSSHCNSSVLSHQFSHFASAG
jgi:hypothetical protein